MMKKVIGGTNQFLLVAAVGTFLASAVTLLFLPEQRFLLLVLLGSGLGMLIEYVLGWGW